MAGDEDRQRVVADESPDSARADAAPEPAGQSTVRRGAAVGDFGEQLPEPTGSFAADGIERQIEFLAFAGEVFAQLRDRLVESVVVARLDLRPECRLIGLGPVPRVVQTGQTVVVTYQSQRSDRGVDDDVTSRRGGGCGGHG